MALQGFRLHWRTVIWRGRILRR